MKRGWLAALAVFFCACALAQSPDSVPETIAAQRKELSDQRKKVMATYEQQARDCWQKFAVNTCLSQARKARRAALDPLQQEELRLNALERAWRTEQRNLRLEGKQAPGASTP